MTQIKFHQPEGIQKKMIELLQSENVHAMVLFGMVRTKGTIEPLIIVADDMPGQEEFIKAFYSLCDEYMHFVLLKELYKNNPKKYDNE